VEWTTLSRQFLADVTHKWTDCPSSVGKSEEIDFPAPFGISNWARGLDSVLHIGFTAAWCEERARPTSANVERENMGYQ
jgi:hypothetical protein